MRPKQYKPRLRDDDAREVFDTIRDPEAILEMRVPITRTPGIYFLFQGEDLVYIGQSLDVTKRLFLHQARKRIFFDAVTVITVNAKHLNYYERIAIDRHQPIFNVGNPPRIPKREKSDRNNSGMEKQQIVG